MFGNPDKNPKHWNLSLLSEEGILDRGKSQHRPRNAAHLYGGSYPFIQTGDVANSNGLITQYSQTYSEAGLAQSRLWKKETLCITIAANIAKTAILGFDACFPDSIVGFIPGPRITVEYVRQWFASIQDRLEKIAPQSAQKNINLEKHLGIMKRQDQITVWYDQDISAGKQWKDEIDSHLNTANIILLLISPDFMNSDYCYSVEMQRALQRHKDGDARVIPVLLRPVDWENAPFSKLQVLPTNSIPVNSWNKLDDAFVNVAREIRKVVQDLLIDQLKYENFHD
jgi:TIR domain/Type I restriction modification DNA specificity domain